MRREKHAKPPPELAAEARLQPREMERGLSVRAASVQGCRALSADGAAASLPSTRLLRRAAPERTKSPGRKCVRGLHLWSAASGRGERIAVHIGLEILHEPAVLLDVVQIGVGVHIPPVRLDHAHGDVGAMI